MAQVGLTLASAASLHGSRYPRRAMARDSQDVPGTLSNLPPIAEPDTLLQSARAKLMSQLSGGEVGLGALARSMHMSERTLRRRLSERGTSYQTLLEELRSTQARTLVGHGTEPVDRIAQRLGFADTSSFFHAFKRWTGQTPAQFRRGLRAER